MEIWDVTVSVMVRVLKFSERNVKGRTFYSCIVDADFLAGPQIVLHDLASRTDDGHFAHFPWLEPAAPDGREAFTRGRGPHACHVFHSRRDGGCALSVDRGG